MRQPSFRPIAAVECLYCPGGGDEQAQALAGLFDEEAATKADLELLKAELKADGERHKLEMQRDMKALEARLVGWLFVQGLTIMGVMFAIVKFVDH